MKLLSLADGHLTVQLSNYQCANAAQACWYAVEHTYDPALEMWRTLAGQFQAYALLGYAHWQMCAADVTAFEEQLRLVGMLEMLEQAELDLAKVSSAMRGVMAEERRQGRAEGARQAALEALDQTLGLRFGEGTATFAAQLEGLSGPRLKWLNAVALRMLSMLEFQVALVQENRA